MAPVTKAANKFWTSSFTNMTVWHLIAGPGMNSLGIARAAMAAFIGWAHPRLRLLRWRPRADPHPQLGRSHKSSEKHIVATVRSRVEFDTSAQDSYERWRMRICQVARE